MLLLLLSCAGDLAGLPAPPDEPDTTGPDDAAAPEDTAEAPGEGEPPRYGCPQGMAAVGGADPAEPPAFCIDAYEVGRLDDGSLASAPGLLPEVGISFEEAAAACAALPAFDGSGAAYGAKRLATAAEWEDAGDGGVGEGGAAFPWGDAFDEGACVTLSAAGEAQFEEMQLTGSLPSCVSAFGVYDQIGNAWEWTDSGVSLDTDAALAALAAAGIALAEAEDGAIRWVSGETDGVELDVAGLQPSTFAVTGEGYVEVDASQIEPELSSFFARGYARVPGEHGAPLPVRLASTDPADPGAPWRLFAAREYDGRALPDKRGCAWYAGTGNACALAEASYTHLPDFDGTIGFRCVAPPYAY